MLSPYKHEALAGVLRQKIAGSAAGFRLPSLRALMKQYDVSLPTVSATLRKLKSEGLIVIKRGSGIYVSAQQATKSVAFHRPLSPSKNLDVREAVLLQAILGERWRFFTRRHAFTHEEKSSLIAEPPASAHIVTPDLLDGNLSFLTQIREQNVPIIILGREAGAMGFDHIASDDQQMMHLLIRHLHGLGHQDFALLINEPHFFEIQQRIGFFLEYLDMLGLPSGTVIDCRAEQGEKSSMMAYHGLLAHVQGRGRPRFTALIVVSAAGGLGALRALHETGIRVPDQCSVACHGKESENMLSIPALTETGSDTAVWGSGVVRMLKQRFAGVKSPPFGMKLPAQLTVRESTS